MEELDKYTFSEETSLKEIIESPEYEFPIIVQTCGNREQNKKPCDDEASLHIDITIKLEKVTEVEYARLKVMPLENEKNTMETEGAEFTAEYKGFVDEEILIPMNYPGTLKKMHPPGKRYVEVSKMIDDLPRFVRFEADTVSTPLPGQTGGATVRKGAVLEVTKVLNKGYPALQYLECTARNKDKYLFRRDALVNCTAIPDDRKYTLRKALTSVPLPKVVKFEKQTTVDDVAACSSMWANNSLVMTYGPMQLLGSEKRRFVVGWHRNKPSHVYNTNDKDNFKVALIPDSRWNTELVKVFRFNMLSGRQVFMDKTFPLCEDPQFVEEKLYILQQNQPLVTWLNSDVVIEKEKSVQASSYPDDMDENGYCTPGPAIPPRAPMIKDVPGKAEQSKVHPGILKKGTVKMKLGFGQIHRQLSVLFKHKDKPQSEKGRESTRRPLPEIPNEVIDSDEDRNHIYDVISESTENKKFHSVHKKYEKLNLSSEQIIMKENQTTKDFCNYTVRLVSKCFRLCALADFGTRCAQNKLDGAFLASYNLQDLKNEPFYLTDLEVKKVELIIHHGWRPS